MLPAASLAISGAATGTSDPVGRGLLIGGTAALGTGAVLLTVGLVLQYVGRGTHTSGAQTIFTIPALTAPTSLLDAPSGPPVLARF